MKSDVNLICTEGSSNKYYNFHDNGNGTFTATYGRIGSTKQKATYSSRMWDSKLREKLKKGYRDVTGVDSKDIEFQKLIKEMEKELAS